MSVTILENGSISIDGKDTGLGVSQGRHGTEVYTREGTGQTYRKHTMPATRYALGSDSPITKPGVATRAQFEADIRDLLKRL